MDNNGHPTHPENTLDGNANTIWDQVDSEGPNTDKTDG